LRVDSREKTCSETTSVLAPPVDLGYFEVGALNVVVDILHFVVNTLNLVADIF
jgi:hypothetical protein